MGKYYTPAELKRRVIQGGSIALMVIAFVATLSSYFVFAGFQQANSAAELVAISGKQSMLAQRTALHAAQAMAATNDRLRNIAASKMQKDMDLLRRNHKVLRDNDLWKGLNSNDNMAISNAYTQQPIALDAKLEKFGINVAEYSVHLTQSGFARILSFREVSDFAVNTFLPAQDSMVQVYVSEAERIQRANKTRVGATFAAILLSLIGIAIFMLRPFADKLSQKASEVDQITQELKSAAIHDPLTKLPNRGFVHQHISHELASAQRHNQKVAVVHLDLDHFKEINDTYGHAAGDCVLVEVSRRLEDCIRTSDVAARIGGDEFVLILADVGSTDGINTVLTRLKRSVTEPIEYDGITLLTSSSMGVAVFPHDGNTGDELVVNADLALYEAKENGRNDFTFFSKSMREELDQRKSLENDLRKAVNEGSLEPFFQPQVCIASRQITGVEALVRWNHPTRGPISPGEFLPVAESIGLMPELGRSVMEKAITSAARWHHEGTEVGRLGLNASSTELRENDFVEWVLKTIKTYQLPPEKLSIEVVETVMLNDERLNAGVKLQQLRDAGIHVELDDFGTGYASLRQINASEIDRLKIDRQFVQHINEQDENAKIVRAIVELAKSLGIGIIAEGAENMAEVETLLSLGVDTIQGFGVAMPMPMEETGKWVSAYSSKITPMSKGRKTKSA